MSFQWDILLIEAGFLTIFFAPIWPFNKPCAFDRVIKEMIRWCMFRLMIASGLVKLLSECPTWWNLTALHYHFETQPIPNAISWYFHHLPDLIKRFGVLFTYYVQLIMPFLFFSPFKIHRTFSAITQNVLLFLIFLTGNYNFFIFLSMTINLANFDDESILCFVPKWVFKLLRFDLPEPQIKIDKVKLGAEDQILEDEGDKAEEDGSKKDTSRPKEDITEASKDVSQPQTLQPKEETPKVRKSKPKTKAEEQMEMEEIEK
jgi:hypothetical protein